MTTLFEFTVIAILTAGVSAVLFFGRRRIHRQMEEIAEAAKSGAFTRRVRFRPLRTLPESDPEHHSGTVASEPETAAATPAA